MVVLLIDKCASKLPLLAVHVLFHAFLYYMLAIQVMIGIHICHYIYLFSLLIITNLILSLLGYQNFVLKWHHTHQRECFQIRTETNNTNTLLLFHDRTNTYLVNTSQES